MSIYCAENTMLDLISLIFTENLKVTMNDSNKKKRFNYIGETEPF